MPIPRSALKRHGADVAPANSQQVQGCDPKWRLTGALARWRVLKLEPQRRRRGVTLKFISCTVPTVRAHRGGVEMCVSFPRIIIRYKKDATVSVRLFVLDCATLQIFFHLFTLLPPPLPPAVQNPRAAECGETKATIGVQQSHWPGLECSICSLAVLARG